MDSENAKRTYQIIGIRLDIFKYKQVLIRIVKYNASLMYDLDYLNNNIQDSMIKC